MAKYRKIDPRIWNDEKFHQLSDQGKLVFFFLLTHPHMTALGAMRATVPGLAAEMNWPAKAFREAFREVLAKGMAKHEEEAHFLWLPKFLKYNRPESPNVVKAWAESINYLPECKSQVELIQQVKDFLKALPEAFQEAFTIVLPKTMPYQEQEQEQEQELPPIIPQGEKELPQENIEVKKVFDHWNRYVSRTSYKGDRQVRWHAHRKLSPEIVSAVQARLGQYPADEICQAIDNYAMVLFGVDFFWSYSWALYEFLTRKQDKEKGSPLQLLRFLPDNFHEDKFRLRSDSIPERKLDKLTHDLTPDEDEALCHAMGWPTGWAPGHGPQENTGEPA